MIHDKQNYEKQNKTMEDKTMNYCDYEQDYEAKTRVNIMWRAQERESEDSARTVTEPGN